MLKMRYLLGTLSDEEREHLEVRYFEDDETFEDIEIVEEELVDAYVCDLLSASERARFEQRLLNSPRLVERTKFAKTLAEWVSSRMRVPPKSTLEPAQTFELARLSWWKALFGSSVNKLPASRAALAACAIIVVVGSALLIVEWRRLRDESRSLATERETIEQQKQDLDRRYAEQRSRNGQLTVELQKEKEQRAQAEKVIEELRRAQNRQEESKPQSGVSSIASLILLPGSLRSTGEGNDLIVNSATATVQLSLSLEANEHPTYRVSIINAARAEVFHRDGLRTRSNRITVKFPSTRLEPGVYEVRISGASSSGALEPVSDYSFRLVRK